MDPRRGSLKRHVGPIEGTAGEKHVPDEGLDGCLADEPDEEELLDDLRADGPQRGKPQKELAEACRLVGVLGPAVLFQCALAFFLQALDVGDV